MITRCMGLDHPDAEHDVSVLRAIVSRGESDEQGVAVSNGGGDVDVTLTDSG